MKVQNMKKNVGNLDATLRVILGIFLIWLGLFQVDGLNGDIWGILISICAVLPFTMAITRICPVFTVFNISSISSKNNNS